MDLIARATQMTCRRNGVAPGGALAECGQLASERIPR
jgi:hypothetical protein